MEVVPGIPSTTKGLGLGIGGLVISQGTSNNDAMIFGEEDAVHVVVGRVLGLGADTSNSFGDTAGSLKKRRHAQRTNSASSTAEQISVLLARGTHNLSISEDHLSPIDRIVEETMLERGTFSRCACETSSSCDTWKLHNHRRHEAMLECRLDELIHGDIGLDKSSAGGLVNLKDIAEGADVDDGLACRLGPGAVGAAVEDAVGLAALEEAADGRGDGGDGLFVALHYFWRDTLGRSEAGTGATSWVWLVGFVSRFRDQ
ncbi:hypothetical protein HG531_008597 [Fusarium graminearum]|nr:hypothetical protein HG531_008597 [Fusarium graminearum]